MGRPARRLRRRAAEMPLTAPTCSGFLPRPSRDFAPAGDLLFGPPKSRQKAPPCSGAPTLRFGVPCASRSPRLAQNSLRYAALKQLREVGQRSALRARLGALRCSTPLRGHTEYPRPNSPQPSPKADSRRLFIHPPFSAAEERKALRPRAQRASRTDSTQLFDRSVAKGVLRGASRPEHRREARCEAKGRCGQGRLFAFFLVAQKEGRPPGRRPGMGLAIKPTSPEAPKCL